MSCGIYAIVNKDSGKRYIGKSIDIERRWQSHLSQLRRSIRDKDTNRHLFNAFKKYGEKSFGFEYLEIVDLNETLLSEKELYWIDLFNTIDRECGYNLRRDTSTQCIVSDETRKLISEQVAGEKNPNYGNSWSDQQKEVASIIAKNNHLLGKYSSDVTKAKHSENSKKFWQENPEIKECVRRKVSIAKTEYKIAQYTKSGDLIKIWDTMMDILEANPDFYRIAIYNCVNGHKKSYRGFLWRRAT